MSQICSGCGKSHTETTKCCVNCKASANQRYQKNKEKRILQVKAYIAANKEKVKLTKAAYNNKHKEEIKIKKQEYNKKK